MNPEQIITEPISLFLELSFEGEVETHPDIYVDIEMYIEQIKSEIVAAAEEIAEKHNLI